jgi:hypothetical protein
MTIVGAQSVNRWYHCVTRCVRRDFLRGGGPNDRKESIVHRPAETNDNTSTTRRAQLNPGQVRYPASAQV